MRRFVLRSVEGHPGACAQVMVTSSCITFVASFVQSALGARPRKLGLLHHQVVDLAIRTHGDLKAPRLRASLQIEPRSEPIAREQAAGFGLDDARASPATQSGRDGRTPTGSVFARLVFLPVRRGLVRKNER